MMLRQWQKWLQEKEYEQRYLREILKEARKYDEKYQKGIESLKEEF